MVEHLEPRIQTLENGYPLAPLQEGMLVENYSVSRKGLDVTQVICDLPERIEPDRMDSAWQWIAARHAVFRTRFVWNETGEQLVCNEASLPWTELDWSECDAKEERLEKLLTEDRQRDFNLSAAPLSRVTLVRFGPAHHKLIWTFHHLIIDARSIAIVLNEVFTRYEALVSGTSVELPAPPAYSQFIQWVNDHDWTQAELFWRANLKGFTSPTALTTRRAHQPDSERKSGPSEQEVLLDSKFTTQLRDSARRHGVTLNTLVQGSWAILLSRYSGEEDVVFGGVRAGRRGGVRGADSMVGVLINTVPIRVEARSDTPLGSWLRQLRQQWTAIRPHEHTSLLKIQGWSEVARGRKLFETAVNVQDPPWDAALRKQGGRWSERTFRILNQPSFPLALDVYADDQIVLKLIYDSGEFDPFIISRMLGHLRTILESMSAEPGQSLNHIPFLSPDEERQLHEDWNQTACDFPAKCVHQLFEDQAGQNPAAIAIGSDHRQISYGELNTRADILTKKLRARGIGPDTLVAIVLPRSVELVTAFVAVLKAGGAFVPIDPDCPRERISGIVEDTKAPVLLTQAALLERLPSTRAQILCVDSPEINADIPVQSTPPSEPTASNLAYVIFTSGTTGRPKGVEIQHRGLSNLVFWHQQTYKPSPSDRATQLASPAFDAAVWEIWPNLASGASIHIPSEETRLSPKRLVSWLLENQITVSFMPTPLAEEVLREPWPEHCSLKLLLTGGDKLRTRPGEQIPFKVFNHYGPTENTIVTSYCPVPPGTDGSAPPIGRPIANTKLFVVDRNLRPVPVGVPGELYITGIGLARSYLNQPEMTAERFIPNPFDCGASRLYRTGDLVRYLPDGNLEYLGRLDQQIKIRGFRIEPGEIEVCLSRHPAISNCVVVARESGSESQLVAYVVAAHGKAADTDDLRAYLRTKLPSYMVPAAFVWLGELPLTSNGKLDRAALPEPPSEPEPANAARTSSEALVAGIWSELLGKANPGLDQNLFEIGGHSLLAARVASRIETAFRVEIPLREVFQRPTIRSLAQWTDEQQAKRNGTKLLPDIPRRDGTAQAALSFAQERLWFMERLQPEAPLNNIPIAIRITGQLDYYTLSQAAQQLITRHESFRTSFHSTGGKPFATIHESADLRIEIIDFSSLQTAEGESEATRISSAEAQRPFNLEEAPLLRIKLLRLGSEENLLLLTTHHLVCDGWSLGIFYLELAELYQSIREGKTSSLTPLPITYTDFAIWQRETLTRDAIENELQFWREQIKSVNPVLELPTERSRPAIQSYRGETRTFALADSLSASLEALAQREDVTMFMLLLAAFQTLLYRYSGQKELLVGSPVSGRTRVETEGIIGLFLNNLVFRAAFSKETTFRDLLKNTRDVALDGFAHRDLPFERLLDSLQIERDLSRSPLFQVMFVLQNTPLQPLALPGLSLTPIAMHSGTSKYDLTLGLEKRSDGWHGYMEYNTDLFSDAGILRMLGHFQTLLEDVVKHPDELVSRLDLLTPAEKSQILNEWNATNRKFENRCVHEFFEAQVARTPNGVAAVFEDDQLTYDELNRRANVLAHHLRSIGIGPETRVGVCAHRSLEMLIGLIAIHKAGGAYVPLDPTYPAERLAYMLEDSSASALITEEDVREKLTFPADRVVLLEKFFATAAPAGLEQNLQSSATPENLAYLIYTSGSTGKPKGVMVLHRNVANFFAAMDERIGVEPGVWLAVTSISFDISVLELFWTLSRGFKVVIQSDENAFRRPASSLPLTQKRIDFSLFYFASHAGGGCDPYRLLIEGARFADAHGLSAVWTPERHFHPFGGLFPNPGITSAALAMVTRHVQLRAGSLVLPLQNPVRVAEDWSLVDNLSNGRAAISFASGWHANDFALAPANYASRRQLLYRDIEIFRRLWRGEIIVMPGGNGEDVRVKIYPQPVQKEIPAWLTSSGDPETFRMAGQLGLNILTHLSGQSLQQVAEKIGVYRKAWQQNGKPGQGHVTLMLHTFVWTDIDSAWQQARKPLRDYLGSYRDLSTSGNGQASRPGADLETLLNEAASRYFENNGLFGPPEHCRKTIESTRDVGVDEIACLIDFGIETESVLKSLKYLGEVKEQSNQAVIQGGRSYSIPEQLIRHRVTHFQCTPSLMNLLLEDTAAAPALSGLKKVMVGGEAFPSGLRERLGENIEFLNMYGPTETTVWSTTHSVRDSRETVPIGRPVANTQIYIVDEEFRPVPINVPGELLIGGAGVTRGYLNRPDLTAERFIPDHFRAAPEARLYRTGDLARYLPSGEIEYLGRADHQVKLRGFRIELGEVETALKAHSAIRDAVVVVREIGANDKRLIGYVTPKTEHRPAVKDLKLFLKDRLPDYMIPSTISFLDALPLTPNGKVDRKALPKPELHRQETEKAFAPAENDLEKSLARVWEEVLQINRVGLNDNFFEIGGHSLLAAQVQARIADALEIELPIIRLFQYPTIKALAAVLGQEGPERLVSRNIQNRAERQRQALAQRARPKETISI